MYLQTSLIVTSAMDTCATLAYSLAALNSPFSISTPRTWSLSILTLIVYSSSRDGGLDDGADLLNSPVILKAGTEE